jgi:hypothetical protein
MRTSWIAEKQSMYRNGDNLSAVGVMLLAFVMMSCDAGSLVQTGTASGLVGEGMACPGCAWSSW